MSRYDGLIIPRSYSEYINKTDAATLQQALQLSGVLSAIVADGDNKAVKSSAVYGALTNYINKTDADTLQQALQLPGVLSGAVAAGDNKPVKSSAVNAALTNYCIFKLGNNLKCNYSLLNGLVIAHFTYSSSKKLPVWSEFFNLPLPLSGSNITFKIGNTINNYNMVILASTGLVQNGIELPAGEYYGSVSYEHS